MTLNQFESAHQEWLNEHLHKRKGEARRKLKSGHAFAEKEFLRLLWWHAFGHFNYLHPEYEVVDFADGKRYIDCVYIRSAYALRLRSTPLERIMTSWIVANTQTNGYGICIW